MLDTLAYYAAVFYRDFAAYTGERLQKLGLHYGLLFFLIYVGKHPGTCPAQVTRGLGVDWGHCQRSLAKLEAAGFIAKERAGRVYRLELTGKGRDAFEMSHRVFAQWDQARLAHLEPGERETLLGLLGKAAAGREVRADV